MTALEKAEAAGYWDLVLLENYSFDDAFVGVTHDNRAIYDFNKMVTWLAQETGWSREDAAMWVEYNTIRAIPYGGHAGPVVMFTIENS